MIFGGVLEIAPSQDESLHYARVLSVFSHSHAVNGSVLMTTCLYVSAPSEPDVPITVTTSLHAGGKTAHRTKSVLSHGSLPRCRLSYSVEGTETVRNRFVSKLF